ncbi:MAG TPA: hypothetical protein VFV97_16135 [Rhodanobacteraceae bacterium]|nr:hypothetical protein [Rhodanobacteraceae bacterium]
MTARLALRFLLAVALILQGSVGAAAVYASGVAGHHCHPAASHGDHARKCPCCPGGTNGAACDDVCLSVAVLLDVPVAVCTATASSPLPVQRAYPVATEVDVPLRPPIA